MPSSGAEEHCTIPCLPDKPRIPGLRRAILGLCKLPVWAEQIYELHAPLPVDKLLIELTLLLATLFVCSIDLSVTSLYWFIIDLSVSVLICKHSHFI